MGKCLNMSACAFVHPLIQVECCPESHTVQICPTVLRISYCVDNACRFYHPDPAKRTLWGLDQSNAPDDKPLESVMMISAQNDERLSAPLSTQGPTHRVGKVVHYSSSLLCVFVRCGNSEYLLYDNPQSPGEHKDHIGLDVMFTFDPPSEENPKGRAHSLHILAKMVREKKKTIANNERIGEVVTLQGDIKYDSTIDKKEKDQSERSPWIHFREGITLRIWDPAGAVPPEKFPSTLKIGTQYSMCASVAIGKVSAFDTNGNEVTGARIIQDLTTFLLKPCTCKKINRDLCSSRCLSLQIQDQEGNILGRTPELFIEGHKTTAEVTSSLDCRTMDYLSMSYLYWARNYLKPSERIDSVSFFDPGRANPLLSSPEEYDREITIKIENMQPMEAMDREIIVVDMESDRSLSAFVQSVAFCAQIQTLATRAQFLACAVSARLGGDPGEVHADAFDNLTEDYIANLRAERKSSIIPLGLLRMGMCRHRTLLFKLLCDVYEVPCFVFRGLYDKNSRHSWNVVGTGMREWKVIDLMLTASTLHPLRALPAYHYTFNGIAMASSTLLESPDILREPWKDLCPLNTTNVKLEYPIGRGVMGITYRASLGGYTVAVKTNCIVPATASPLWGEWRWLCLLRGCEHVVKPLGIDNDSKVTKLYLEYRGYSLLTYMNSLRGNMSMASIVTVALGVVTALQALHTLGGMHRDIKAENVLLDVIPSDLSDLDSTSIDASHSVHHVQLCDFTEACRLSEIVPGEDPVGTEIYMAPEVQRRQAYGASADIYSVGVLIHEMVHMSFLNLPNAKRRKMTSSAAVRQESATSSQGHPLQYVIDDCLRPDPAARPAAADLVRLLQSKARQISGMK